MTTSSDTAGTSVPNTVTSDGMGRSGVASGSSISVNIPFISHVPDCTTARRIRPSSKPFPAYCARGRGATRRR